MLVSACSGGTPVAEQDAGAATPDVSGPIGGDAATDAAAPAPIPIGNCNTIVNRGPDHRSTAQSLGKVPTLTGGTIKPGTYVRTATLVYTDVGPPGREVGNGDVTTVVIDGNSWEETRRRNGQPPELRASYDFVIEGNQLRMTGRCRSSDTAAADRTYQFQASGGSLTIRAEGTSGPIDFTYRSL